MDASNTNITSDAFTYCAPYVPVDHPSSAPLEPYIHEAEQIESIKPTSGTRIFSHPSIAPRLRSSTVNRILVYTGCFTPPHLGHLELLAHIFLRTDSSTIAAMLITWGDGVCEKNSDMVNGKKFKLTKTERAALLQDEILGRFSWVFRADRNSHRFIETMIELANADGYQLEFTSLHGSDHWELHTVQTGLGWGSGSLITSDITRPSVFMSSTQSVPDRFDGCGEWRKILPAKRAMSKGGKICWACWKFQILCPELMGEGIGKLSEFSGFGGIAIDILRRCHENEGVLWWCHRDDNEGSVWFFPSGREYPKDARRQAISSTKIRRLLNRGPQDKQGDNIKSMALNSDKLMSILGLLKHSHGLNLGLNSGFDDATQAKDGQCREAKLKIRKLERTWDNGDE